MAVHAIIPNAYDDVLCFWGKIGITAVAMIFLVEAGDGIVGGY